MYNWIMGKFFLKAQIDKQHAAAPVNQNIHSLHMYNQSYCSAFGSPESYLMCETFVLA